MTMVDAAPGAGEALASRLRGMIGRGPLDEKRCIVLGKGHTFSVTRVEQVAYPGGTREGLVFSLSKRLTIRQAAG